MTDIEEIIPQNLAVDLAIMINQFAEMYNCNNEILEQYDIDWWYLHKLNRRCQFHLNKNKNVDKNN